MPVSVTMPQLGESVTEGTVTRWLKKEGERVETDEPLLEVSTDKVDTEIPSPASGILTSITVAEDETVEVGAELAVIGDEGDAPSGGGAPAAAEQAPAQEAPAPQAEQAAPPQEAPPQQAPQQAPPPAAWPPPAQQQPAAPPSPAPAPAPQQPAQPPAPAPAPASRQAQPQAEPGDGPYVTPLVRKLASEHNVDLATVKGTGVGGRIRKQDVLEAARAAQQAAQQAAAPAAPAPAAPAPAQAPAARPAAPAPAAAPAEQLALRGRTEKMSRMRQTIARRMVESLQVSAQLTTVVEVDITKIARLREQAKADFQAREGVKLSFLPFFALATVEALKAHPKLNAVINGETNEVTYHDVENLSIAVDVPERGLMVPVVHNAGQLNLGGLAQRIADLAERTRTNKVSPDELAGGTFTLTNTGSRGALFDTPILNQPQVGMLGTGAVVKRPAVIDDPELGEVIAVRSMVYLALTYDHRLIDGADAARFLATVKHRLEEGNFEAELGL
ncbi:2-oxoglutarate dehydrogenase, E2 component, dihydrolipoamide succinyltransferase [Actinomadura madurae]|uniref:2-oxoglutarate dehydrogenase, E2 component, dihydrolipoamide succinyltransferase n=1 Tax=Actinomadura madurae TaxID=1993 RepID=UPI0020D2458E|nr:2-oxoglutarate dehydrogenase, E2 component, dihydrolipoamide succinyltransferase [Actinomadura madurae]MCP9971530.1 2-oxoglutarate dehydrogenase, E2 component, dihydrolipoamide succinyltransferase [Actinomadura madurae]MCQ0020253.1 2-oxoglutarate dehydrogenase, E2 component, dihydrolipoamide succinyltransferase [Actinomadura madurae]